MSNTNQINYKFYTVIIMHPQHGIRSVETLAASLKLAEETTAKQWASTQWKVDFCA